MIKPLPLKSGKTWPWNRITETLRPATWGLGMTVCIAAHAYVDDCIVCASDMMITTTDMSSDFASVKSRSVGQSWLALFAGSDISAVDPIINEVRDVFADPAYPDTVSNVRDAFVGAFRNQLKLKTENEILQPLGYSLGEFKESGLEQLGGENFSRLLYKIQDQSIDVEFLVAGFDQNGAHIFTVTSPGKVSDYTPVGLWAIGTGQTNALGSLFNCKNSMFAPDIHTTMYRVCEAKFNAETAAGVGKKTVLSILRNDGERVTMSPQVEAFRSIWEKTRVLTIPEEAHKESEKIWSMVCAEFDKRKAASNAAALAQLPAAVSTDPKHEE